MKEGVIAFVVLMGVVALFAFLAIVGEWWEGRKKERKQTKEELLHGLKEANDSLDSRVRELTCRMEALLWHLNLEAKPRGWQPYFEMVEREKK